MKIKNISKQNQDIISLIIISIGIFILIILSLTGYPTKYVRKHEHFFSSIKKWINGDDEVKPYNDDASMLSSNNIHNTSLHEKSKIKVSPEKSLVEEKKNIKNIINTTNLLKDNNITSKLPDIKIPLEKKNSNTETIQNLKTGPLPLNNDHNNFIKKMSFQFFDEDDEPDKKKYTYTGAEIGLNGSVSCGNSNIKKIKAEGIAILDKDGSISDIKMLNHGKGYKTPPKVVIQGGGGSGCKAKAVVDDKTTVVHIEILDNGIGYVSTPSVIIDSPNASQKCKLYIKNM